MLFVAHTKPHIAGESNCASALPTEIIMPRVEKLSLVRKSVSELTEEYKDSLELSAVDQDHGRTDDDGIKSHDPFDTVEQDSLETNTKVDTIKTNEVTPQFLPFAQIGANWSSDYCAAQNSTCELNRSTNQNVVETESINITNELQTNSNTISTNPSVDYDFRDLPGI